MNVRKMVKETREANGWSVNELASHCGVSPRTAEGWEQGRGISGPSLKTLRRLSTECAATGRKIA